MSRIPCKPNGSCPYQYSCNSANNCIHYPIFPIDGYPIAIYLLFPFASALCNISGNSFGQYKVLLLMVALNYTQTEATTLCYPLIVGTALFNFFNLIMTKHPQKNKSVIDFNIVMLIIPSVLYGSTLGALANKFIIPVVADVLIIVILGSFSVKFFLRFYNFRKQQKEKEKNKVNNQIQLNQLNNVQSNKQQLKNELIQKDTSPKISNCSNYSNLTQKGTNYSQYLNKTLQQQNPYQLQLQKQLKYDQSYHIPHVISTIIIFIIFQCLSFLAQGKIINFSICSKFYVIGIILLTAFYIAFAILMFFYTKKKMNYYKKINYKYQYKLDTAKFFLLTILASLLGGFNGGIFGVGGSTTIIFLLLFLGIQPVVVSATVGYQVLFLGLGSLGEAFATNDILLKDAGLFFVITLVLGGILSFFSIKLVRKFQKNKVNQIIMIIIGCLTGFSSIGMIINLSISFGSYGKEYMISPSSPC